MISDFRWSASFRLQPKLESARHKDDSWGVHMNMPGHSPMRKRDVLDGRFTLREQIAGGRMSSVYRAQDVANGGTEVAVKILDTPHSDEIKRELFKREADALKRLRHPNIVTLRHSDWASDEQVFYLVFDYLPYSLDKYLKGEQRSQYGDIEPYRVMRELAEALVHAHSENLIHRDIKPSNILFDPNGRPMLTDFGISKLLTQLTVGETLAEYWSSGYASPEQRAAKPASTSSDIYSLGATFFHLLSGQEPPPEGPTPAMVDRSVNGPPLLRNVVKRMLAANPDSRPASGSELLSALEITRSVETLPSHFLILTNTAIRDIVSAGYATEENFQEVAEAVSDDLGGMELDEVDIHVDNRNKGDLIVLGASLRLVCTPDEDGDALIVKAVHTPYIANLEAERGRSMPYRALWLPVQGWFRSEEDNASLTAAVDHLTHLLSKLSSYDTIGDVNHERRSSRREFIERWRTALSHELNRIEREASSLAYSEVVEESDYLRFTLTELPRDGINWEDDTPLAVRETVQARPRPVGNLVGIRGRMVEVARQTRRPGWRDSSIPGTGLLTLNMMEARSANTRQQSAVNAFLYEQMANPNLANVIIDPSNTTRSQETNLDFFQDRLSDDTKAVVRKAISSNELFLIQGPPGTGKTTLIAEIVLQILRQNPDARILLTSQSNVAVDHALTQIANAADDPVPEMVRIGRAEKIGSGGEAWTLEERARSWRQDVLDKCRPVIDELRKREREARAAVKTSIEPSDAETATAGTIEEWIAEAKDIAALLHEYELEYASLGSDIPAITKAEAADAVEQTRTQLREQLSALNELLPKPLDLLDMKDESTALGKIIEAAASPALTESELKDPAQRELRRIQELRKVLSQWTGVVGLTSDFQFLIGRSARVVAATCLFSANLFKSDSNRGTSESEIRFDWAIIDEAGRATVPEILVPIVKSERAILVGDERQLPPMVDALVMQDSVSSTEDHSLDTSLFQILIEQAEGSTQEYIAGLRTQYRMQPAIGDLVSAVFYEGKLENGDLPRSRWRVFDWMPAPVTWLSTSSLPNRAENRSGESFANSAEADTVLQLLDKMEAKCRERRRRPTVGVITGYAAQVEQLITRINPTDRNKWRNLEIEIATVDSFQGRECDVVVYSTVRSNRNSAIGFLKDFRRINVALSRARDLLVIVGDDFMMEHATMGPNLNPFASVLNHIRSHPDECRIVQSNIVSVL